MTTTLAEPVGPPAHLNPREADPKRWAALRSSPSPS